MTATIDGIAIRSGVVSMPLTGVWHAECCIDSDTALSVGAVVPVVLGSATLTGTVRRSGLGVGLSTVQVVGGRGGLSSTVAARYYASGTARIVALDALTEVGESLSPTADASLASLQVARWTRAAGTASEALDAVARAVGMVWRVLDDGTVWMGTDSWADATPADSEVVADAPELAARTYADDGLSLRPGTTAGGVRVASVIHRIAPEAYRSDVYAPRETGETADPVRAAMAAAVGRMQRRTDLYAMHPARVVAQSADGLTVDVQPDSSAIPPMTGVPLRQLGPGIVVRVQPGARVYVGHASGDPRLPYASVFEGAGSLVSLAVGGTSDAAALASLVLAELQSIKLALETHVHSGVTTGPGTSGTAAPVYTPGSVASTRVLTDA